MVERKLGRGLQFLLSDSGGAGEGSEEVVQVDVAKLLPNRHQPRSEFRPEELEDLAQSIRISGILQPILVRRQGDRFEIIAGERRFRAAQLVGLEKVPALVRDVEESKLLLLALVENLQRADLNAIEKAKALREIQAKGGWTQEDLAKQVGMSRAAAANLMRLLDLPDAVQAFVSRGTLSAGHARALLGLADREVQEQAAHRIIRESLSVRGAEKLVQDLGGTAPAPGDGSGGTSSRDERSRRPSWLVDLEQNLTNAFEAPVTIRYGRKGGRVTLSFSGREEFDRLYARLMARG